MSSFVSKRTAFLWLPVALFATACSSSSSPEEKATFTAAPLTTVMSDTKQLKVEVRTTSTESPPRGLVPVELLVSDGAGAPVPGLTLVVVPFMPAMGHGSSVQPTVADMGEGHYLLTNVELFMPGTWELRTTFSGKATDHAAPALDVQ